MSLKRLPFVSKHKYIDMIILENSQRKIQMKKRERKRERKKKERKKKTLNNDE
jgi:hypothetical protein